MSKLLSNIGDGIEYCNQCPFLAYDKKKKSYICSPNDLVMGTDDNILVPEWCGNKKQS